MLATGIAATICGEKRYLEIPRSDLRFFEAVHGPALRIMSAIRSLEWDIETIRAIIKFASLPPRQAGDLFMSPLEAAARGESVGKALARVFSAPSSAKHSR